MGEFFSACPLGGISVCMMVYFHSLIPGLDLVFDLLFVNQEEVSIAQSFFKG